MINKEEIIQQFEARGASKETIDKIKNATEGEAVDLAWEQLGWLERMWGRAFWWIVWFLVCSLASLISNYLSFRFPQMNDTWKWIIAIIAALVLVWILRSLWRLLWRLILATRIALISTRAQRRGELLSNEINRLHAQGLKHDEIPAEVDKKFSNSRQPTSEKLKTLMFIIDLPFRFVFVLFGFTFGGWIGWLGIVLIGLKLFHVIGLPWWVAALPLEYGVLYCLYMTIDGALYRAGWKDIGGYARFTASDEELAHAEVEQVLRNLERANPAKLGGKGQS